MKCRLDFVTNSSSSCFVCYTGMSAKEVEKKLRKMLRKFNDEHGLHLTFGEVFNPPFHATEDKLIKEYHLHHWGYKKSADKNKLGKILIFNADDNSIPCDMFEEIEDEFNAERYYLG